jgi:hypothetical protein
VTLSAVGSGRYSVPSPPQFRTLTGRDQEAKHIYQVRVIAVTIAVK